MKHNFFIISVFAVVLFLDSSVTAQWVQTNGPGGWEVTSIAVSDTNIFAGFSGYGQPGGIYLSTNNCKSWTNVNNGLPDHIDIRALGVKGTAIFVGAYPSGYFRSTNNGASWDNITPPLGGLAISFAVVGSNL